MIFSKHNFRLVFSAAQTAVVIPRLQCLPFLRGMTTALAAAQACLTMTADGLYGARIRPCPVVSPRFKHIWTCRVCLPLQFAVHYSNVIAMSFAVCSCYLLNFFWVLFAPLFNSLGTSFAVICVPPITRYPKAFRIVLNLLPAIGSKAIRVVLSVLVNIRTTARLAHGAMSIWLALISKEIGKGLRSVASRAVLLGYTIHIGLPKRSITPRLFAATRGFAVPILYHTLAQ